MKKYLSLFLSVLMLFVCFSVLSSVQTLNGLEGDFLTSFEEVDSINQRNAFGFFVKTKLDQKETIVGGEKIKNSEVVFNLFGFIPLKKVSVKMIDDTVYYVGGVPIGLCINTDGAMVLSDERSYLKEGDILQEINGKQIESIDEIPSLLSGEEVEVKLLRKNKELKTLIKTIPDENGKLRLGLLVKDDVSGVGTLTLVNRDNLHYCALGHPIVDGAGGNVVPVASGNVVECDMLGIEKGKKNVPGQLRCVFGSTKSKGTIETNGKFGISGVLSDTDLIDENVTAMLGGRFWVRPGKAKIVSAISGIREEYDIEIIKANYQKTEDDKSIVFRVTDKRLLSLSGGIVQGMSGSPIMQDGKLVGAVTHVFMNDSTKGYGVYTDFMV